MFIVDKNIHVCSIFLIENLKDVNFIVTECN